MKINTMEDIIMGEIIAKGEKKKKEKGKVSLSKMPIVESHERRKTTRCSRRNFPDEFSNAKKATYISCGLIANSISNSVTTT